MTDAELELVKALENITKDCFGDESNRIMTCSSNLAYSLRLLAKCGRCKIVEDEGDNGWVVAEWVTK